LTVNGHILYKGKSEFGSGNIVVLMKETSTNKKTGNIPSITMLPDIGKKPSRCLKDGDDHLVCGTCTLRKKICYVATSHAPNQMYKSYTKGSYIKLNKETQERVSEQEVIRIGQYGDCASVPTKVWTKALKWLPPVLNYTHFWREKPRLHTFALASVHSPEERQEAKALGFKTYRIKNIDDPVLPGEVLCPGDLTKSNPIQCKKCKLCVVSKQTKDIVVNVHGTVGKIRAFKEA